MSPDAAPLPSPRLQARIAGVLYLATIIGETALCLWLLIVGLDAPKWLARAKARP